MDLAGLLALLDRAVATVAAVDLAVADLAARHAPPVRVVAVVPAAEVAPGDPHHLRAVVDLAARHAHPAKVVAAVPPVELTQAAEVVLAV